MFCANKLAEKNRITANNNHFPMHPEFEFKIRQNLPDGRMDQ
jgi:hypothetical protein